MYVADKRLGIDEMSFLEEIDGEVCITVTKVLEAIALE